MLKSRIKRLLLPIGLLLFGVAFLITRIDESLVGVRDFVIGVGAAFVISAFLLRTKMFKN